MVKTTDYNIEKLVREKLGGKSYSEIRSELFESGLSEEEVSSLIRQVDQKVLEATTREGKMDRARQWYRAGLFLAITGLIISIAYNAGIILGNLPALAVYSPFIVGILVMFYGRMMQRRRPGSLEKGPGPIRRKRPFK